MFNHELKLVESLFPATKQEVLYVPIMVSPSSRLWLFRPQWPASLHATSVFSSCWLPSFSFSLFALDWLAADWFVILPADTGEEILQHSIGVG